MNVKIWNVLWRFAVVLCLCLPSVQADESPSVLGILEIRGLDNVAASAFELSKAAGNPMPKEALSLILYGALGTMPGLGLQPEGNVRALWLDNGTDKGAAAVLLPVENAGTDYLASLGQAGWKDESEAPVGIQHFVAPEGARMAWSEAYFLKSGSLLVAAQTADDVRRADAAMPYLPPILPVEGDVALQVRPAALLKAFGAKIQAGMDQAFQANPAVPAESVGMAKLYVRGYMAAAKQLDEFTLGLGVANGNLNIHTRMAPVAGTTLAKWLATVRPASTPAAVVNLPGALFVETANIGDPSLLAPVYFRYMDELLALVPKLPDAEFMKTYMENLQAAWAQTGGDFGIALMPPTKESPLRAVEYLALKDSSALRDLTRQMVQSENELMKAMMLGDTNRPPPFQLNLASGEPREYRGIPVDTLTYSLIFGKGLAPLWPEGLSAKLNVETAWIPGGMLVAVGDSALTDALVDRALDGGVAPVSDLPVWKALYPAPEKDLVDLAHVALFDMLRAYLGMADSFTGGRTAENIPAGSGDLESASYMAMGGAMSRLRLRLADIAAVGGKIREAREKAMAATMEHMPVQGELQIEEEDGAESMEAADYTEENAGADAKEAPAPLPTPAGGE
jgi:hypothetical protein